MPLKRFFTLHGKEFSKKYPVFFKTICEGLGVEVETRFDYPASQKATD